MNWFVDIFNFYIGYHGQMQDTPPQELRFSTCPWIYHDGVLSAECLATATPSTLEVSMLACPTRAYSASSSGSCSFCALVRAPTHLALGTVTRLSLGAWVGVAGSEEITRGRFGSAVIAWGVLAAGEGSWSSSSTSWLTFGSLLSVLLYRDLLRYSLLGSKDKDFRCCHRFVRLYYL